MNSYSLADLEFPIFRIGTTRPEEENGKLFFRDIRKNKDGELVEVDSIIDDKNLPQPTMTYRRIALLCAKTKLYNLNTAIFFLGDLIKLAKPQVWFIDSNGFLFQYTKSRTMHLIFKPIKQLIPIPTGGTIVEVEGISHRFKTLFGATTEKYAGILKLGHLQILYGLYNNIKEDSWRRV